MHSNVMTPSDKLGEHFVGQDESNVIIGKHFTNKFMSIEGFHFVWARCLRGERFDRITALLIISHCGKISRVASPRVKHRIEKQVISTHAPFPRWVWQ